MWNYHSINHKIIFILQKKWDLMLPWMIYSSVIFIVQEIILISNYCSGNSSKITFLCDQLCGKLQTTVSLSMLNYLLTKIVLHFNSLQCSLACFYSASSLFTILDKNLPRAVRSIYEWISLTIRPKVIWFHSSVSSIVDVEKCRVIHMDTQAQG